MTDNRKIAEWVGVIPEPAEWLDGCVCYMSGHHEALAYCKMEHGEKKWLGWAPDTDITLWHGEGGLLEKINTGGIDHIFYAALYLVVDPKQVTSSRSGLLSIGAEATPAQLAAALVKMIENVE